MTKTLSRPEAALREASAELQAFSADLARLRDRKEEVDRELRDARRANVDLDRLEALAAAAMNLRLLVEDQERDVRDAEERVRAAEDTAVAQERERTLEASRKAHAAAVANLRKAAEALTDGAVGLTSKVHAARSAVTAATARLADAARAVGRAPAAARVNADELLDLATGGNARLAAALRELVNVPDLTVRDRERYAREVEARRERQAMEAAQAAAARGEREVAMLVRVIEETAAAAARHGGLPPDKVEETQRIVNAVAARGGGLDGVALPPGVTMPTREATA